jgi:outer membrane protein TolC
LSVDELFGKGIENSTKIKASQLKYNILEDKEALAKNLQLPEINASAMDGFVGQPTIFDKNFTLFAHPYMPDLTQSYAIEATQPIYAGGKIKYTVKNASIAKEIAGLNLEKDKADIKLVLIKNYLTLYSLYKQKEIFNQNIEVAKKRLHDIEQLKKEGIITNNDVLRSQIVVTQYHLSLQETNNDIAIISQQIDIVLGLDENTIIVPDTEFLDKVFLLKSENEYITEAFENFPEIKIAQYNIETAKNNEKITKAKYLPNVFLHAGNTLSRPITVSSPVLDMYMNSWSIVLGIKYNISSWFDHKHEMSEDKYNIDLQENIKTQNKENVRTSIKSAYIKHQEALDRINALGQTVVQAKDNYRITNNKYFNQMAILTDVLDAENVQLNTELQLTNAKTQMIYTYYVLLNASGNL